MSDGQEVGAAVTYSPWPTLWAPGPAARRGRSESWTGSRRHGQEVGVTEGTTGRRQHTCTVDTSCRDTVGGPTPRLGWRQEVTRTEAAHLHSRYLVQCGSPGGLVTSTAVTPPFRRPGRRAVRRPAGGLTGWAEASPYRPAIRGTGECCRRRLGGVESKAKGRLGLAEGRRAAELNIASSSCVLGIRSACKERDLQLLPRWR